MDKVIGHCKQLTGETFQVYFRHLFCTVPGHNALFELVWYFHTPFYVKPLHKNIQKYAGSLTKE